MQGLRRIALRATLALTASAVVVAGTALPALAAPGDISITDVSVAEGDAGAVDLVFTVSYNGPPRAQTVDWATADDTATAGEDYVAGSGTVNLPANEDKSATITVQVLGDVDCEGDEVFVVNLSNNSHGQLLDPQGVGTILDDDVACDPGDPGDPVVQSSLTLKLRTTKSKLICRGVLEPATSTSTVRVILQKRQGGKWVKAKATETTVKRLGDRDADSVQDAIYTVAFGKPSAGKYRVVARFAGEDGATKASRSLKTKI